MYIKNLSEDLRLRLSQRDMDFLKSLAVDRNTSVSEVIRSIIGEYRRSLETVEALNKALSILEVGHGVTETNVNDKL